MRGVGPKFESKRSSTGNLPCLPLSIALIQNSIAASLPDDHSVRLNQTQYATFHRRLGMVGYCVDRPYGQVTRLQKE